MRLWNLHLWRWLAIASVAIFVSDTSLACDDGGVSALLRAASSVTTFLEPRPKAPKDLGNYRGIMGYLGQCEKPNQNNLRGQKTDTYHLVARDDEAKAFEAYFESHPNEHWTRFDGRPLDVTDFIAIDVVARTLMGEMGSEEMCGHGNATLGKGYMAAAARVIMNRGIEILNDPEHYAKMFGSKKVCTDSSQCIANAALMRKQFSLWNKLIYDEPTAERLAHSKNKTKKKLGEREVAANYGQERVTEKALCPIGTDSQPAGASTQRAWKDAVELAIEAVANPDKLKAETPDIKAFWYTSNVAMRGGIHLPDGHAYGRLLNNDVCLQLWKDGGARAKTQPLPASKTKVQTPRPKPVAKKILEKVKPSTTKTKAAAAKPKVLKPKTAGAKKPILKKPETPAEKKAREKKLKDKKKKKDDDE